MELTTKQQAQVIRAALRKQYKGITIRKSSGTAAGWINIGHEVNRPFDCSCTPNSVYCNSCKNVMNGISSKIENEALKALKEFNSKPYTFLSDDGYNTEHNCILTQVSIATA